MPKTFWLASMAGRLSRSAVVCIAVLACLGLLGYMHAPLSAAFALRPLHADGVVLQQRSQSCGPAAVATVRTYYYGIPVRETDIVEPNGKDAPSSMTELAEAVKRHGFKGMGLALSFEQLRLLKQPAVAYLKFAEGAEHYVVIRGFDAEGNAWLADPAQGNIVIDRKRFQQAWETRDHPVLKGKILLVLPESQTTVTPRKDYFGTPSAELVAKRLM